MQPRIITREPRRQGFRYPDSAVAATVKLLLDELGADQVVGFDDPLPTANKARGRAHIMRKQIEDSAALGTGRVLRKTVVKEGDTFVPAVYVVAEPKRSRAKAR